jgi:hypothetical protein
VLVDNARQESANPWDIPFVRMFDQTNDAELFHTAAQLEAQGLKLHGNIWRHRNRVFLPLYEAKMAQAYDHRAASVLVERPGRRHRVPQRRTGHWPVPHCGGAGGVARSRLGPHRLAAARGSDNAPARCRARLGPDQA